MNSSVSAHDRSPYREALDAHELVKQGQVLLEKKAWREARAAFDAARRSSIACLPQVGDSYAAIGSAAQDKRVALYCHREAKRCYKGLCKDKLASQRLGEPDLGRTWYALGAQYSKLSDLERYNRHAMDRALASYTRALDHMEGRDRPDAYRARLDAATHRLTQKRRLAWLGHARRQAALRGRAWEDASMLLRIPAWSDASRTSWEAVAELCAVCPDKTSKKFARRHVLPLLTRALSRAPEDTGHGNPWSAAVAMMNYHPGCIDPVLDAARRAAISGALAAERLPWLLSCYDTALTLAPDRALAAAADLPGLRADFAGCAHALGNLVFTAGRFLEAAHKCGDAVAGLHALRAVADVAEHTRGEDAPAAAAAMLGYVAKCLPDFGQAAVSALAALVDRRLASTSQAEPELYAATVRALAAAGKKPVPRPIRAAACLALARSHALGEACGHVR